MNDHTEDNPVKTLSLKLVYPIAAVVALLVIANLFSQPDSRPGQRHGDLIDRFQNTASPWLDRAERVSEATGSVVDAGFSYAEGLAESFNRKPDGE